MIDNGQDGGDASDADSTSGLESYKQQVADLNDELLRTLQSQGLFIMIACASVHLESTNCDCEERIRAINERLGELGAFDKESVEVDLGSEEPD